MTKYPVDLITILGPTASGKTPFAAHLAHHLGDAEIISADSRMVYRGMTIGSGKDLDDYVVDGHHIPYHLIDICEAGYRFNVYEFQCAFQNAFMDITAREQLPIMCGGTGLYIESVLKSYELGQVRFPERNSLTIGLSIERDLRREKISRRLKARLEEGMIEEVQTLLQTVSAEKLIRYGLEYKFVTLYCLGQLSYDEMYRQLEIAIHQFAKRQMTWFRGMEERRGIPIHWIDATLPHEDKVQIVLDLLNGK
ncbi:MAG: tRNA (adenosine(37)-N6)-dimethylallyltransferase MiaA [Bacteroidaceae bacterium]|nr:tRNA (adenosine(37)-N6)-dimethylallyltransferase MiaA [Bacteroidaceae bacterium]MBQ5838735.1 tRNA (adenosine(37)-N6)-dimethylallyltransferase MiaA [Bacteroidaceae bacterium]